MYNTRYEVRIYGEEGKQNYPMPMIIRLAEKYRMDSITSPENAEIGFMFSDIANALDFMESIRGIEGIIKTQMNDMSD